MNHRGDYRVGRAALPALETLGDQPFVVLFTSNRMITKLFNVWGKKFGERQKPTNSRS